MEEILISLGIALLATVKYLFAAVLSFAHNHTGLQGFLLVSAGGIVGVILCTYLSDKLNRLLKNYFNRRKKTGFLRLLIKLRHSYGLLGLSILTPVLISIPVGCYFAKTFIKSNRRIVLYMSASVILWGILIFGVKTIFNINLMENI